MAPDTGRIHEIRLQPGEKPEEKAKRLGLVHIPPTEENKVRSLNTHQRKMWAKEQLKKERKLAKQKRKAANKARRNNRTNK